MPAGLLAAALVTLVMSPASALHSATGVVNAPGGTGHVPSPRAGSIDAHTVSSAMFARSLDAVMFTAPDGRILAANPAACRVLGLSEEEIRQRGRGGFADPSDSRWAVGLRERESTGRFFGELSMLRGDGSPFPAEVSSAVFENEFGELRTVVVFRDITHRDQPAPVPVSAPLNDEGYDLIAQTLLDVAFRRLWAVGTSLQAGLQGPPDLLIAKAESAIDDLDDTIRDLRNTLLAGD